MPTDFTEDEVRGMAHKALEFDIEDNNALKQGTGQITTFKSLGVGNSKNKPDGWYIPKKKSDVAIILEAKNSQIEIDDKKWINELKKNCAILMEAGYKNVVGLLYNGKKTLGFLNNEPIEISNTIEKKQYYFNLVNSQPIDKEKIYKITAHINDCLHFEFGVKDLKHRMIFTACALVAQRYGAQLDALAQIEDIGFEVFQTRIRESINKEIEEDRKKNEKIQYLITQFDNIKMNTSEKPKALKKFIKNVCEISNCINSNEWRGEDVMGIFFNEFNRYKGKAEAGQVFTPEHITSFMYRLIGITQHDFVGDFCCGSGAFLVKSMCNMMKSAGGYDTAYSQEIRQKHLFGIESDEKIYALACANMLIHKDGKTNIDCNDMRTPEACNWVKSKPITKVLMNPPYETKYGCLQIVENVLNSVKVETDCAFILPDKKLEKSPKYAKSILSKHTLVKIIKLPEPLFFGIGVTTSIFVFKAGKPQNGQKIFGCYIEDDGLETVKNKGRHDIKHKWQDIEDYWIDSISKLRDDKYHTDQWIDPEEHLSYQMPEKAFEISEEDFKKTAMDYICFKRGIDTKEFGEKLLNATLYGSRISSDDTGISIIIRKNGDSE